MAEPGRIPYRWFWILGAVLIVGDVFFALQGDLPASAALSFAGISLIVLGAVERHRGAPPV